jgi:5-methylcytosine-specific restriction enzyme subunit McrC
VHRQLAGVSDRPLSRALFQRVQLGRNNRHYDLLLRICSLILDSLLPGEGAGRTRFADILADEVRMSTVFEAFVRNFYRSEQSAFRVGADHLAWMPAAPIRSTPAFCR